VVANLVCSSWAQLRGAPVVEHFPPGTCSTQRNAPGMLRWGALLASTFSTNLTFLQTHVSRFLTVMH